MFLWKGNSVSGYTIQIQRSPNNNNNNNLCFFIIFDLKISKYFLRMSKLTPYDRDSSPVSHFTLCSTKRSSSAPACKIPCPLLPCSNTRQWKWPFCILVWRIHHWLLSDRVLDERDHLSVAAWQSLGSAVTIWGVCVRIHNCCIMAWLGVWREVLCQPPNFRRSPNR